MADESNREAEIVKAILAQEISLYLDENRGSDMALVTESYSKFIKKGYSPIVSAILAKRVAKINPDSWYQGYADPVGKAVTEVSKIMDELEYIIKDSDGAKQEAPRIMRDDSGKLHVVYEQRRAASGAYVLREAIPDRILSEGENSIIKFAKEKFKEFKEEIEKDEEKDMRKNNIPIKTIYDGGIDLEGRIVGDHGGSLHVELDIPIEGKYIERMYGWDISSFYTEEGNLSEPVLFLAKHCLENAYKEALSSSFGIGVDIDRLNDKLSS